MITKPLKPGTIKNNEDIDNLNWKDGFLCTPKYDGIRCVKVNGRPLSNNFKDIPNKYIRNVLTNILPDGFDGEILLKDPNATFQQISSAVMSFEGEPDFIFKAFDYVKDDLNKPYYLRMDDLQIFSESKYFDGNRIDLVLPTMVKNSQELYSLEDEFLAQNYEGIMLRDPSGIYKCNRSTVKQQILLKLKRFTDSEAVILDFYEKMHNENEQERNELGYAKRSHSQAGKIGADTLGAFFVRDIHTGIEFKIGTGFNDSLRSKVWDNKDEYIGKIIHYKYQDIGVKVAPRFPTFLSFRDVNDI